MENVVSVMEVEVHAGSIVPCIKVLRGLDIAARQQHATFVIHASFSYVSRGAVVNLPESVVPFARTTTDGESRDPVWTMLDLPSVGIPSQPDPGTQFTCNAKITITGVTGLPTDVGYLDTALISPTAPG